jgi:D-glycero-D-manno-heptose 1,7-bisphosphate phosphatase
MDAIAVFLDRDGTINEEGGYINHVDRLKLIDGAAEAVALLGSHGLKTIVVTNQAGVARGYYPAEHLPKLHDRLRELLKEGGAELDAIYYCPHHPDVGEPPFRKDCDCRKPRLGMIRSAEREHGVDAARSYMVGDKISDVEFGRKAGCKSILVLTGYGKGELEYHRDKLSGEPDYIADDLLDAAKWIVRDLEARRVDPA